MKPIKAIFLHLSAVVEHRRSFTVASCEVQKSTWEIQAPRAIVKCGLREEFFVPNPMKHQSFWRLQNDHTVNEILVVFSSPEHLMARPQEDGELIPRSDDFAAAACKRHGRDATSATDNALVDYRRGGSVQNADDDAFTEKDEPHMTGGRRGCSRRSRPSRCAVRRRQRQTDCAKGRGERLGIPSRGLEFTVPFNIGGGRVTAR
jgi:hypothetical protein